MEAVSALIPTYNAERTIARALASVLGQVADVIVVNDGSTDGTAALIRRQFPQVTLINLAHNQGVGSARNVCLAHCKTPFAAWLDSDDIFLPERVNTLRTALEAGADYVFDEMEIVDQHLHQTTVATLPDFLMAAGGLAHQFGRNFIKGIGIPMVRTKSARAIGYAPLRNAEDYDHFLRALLAGRDIVLRKTRTYRQYLQRESQSADFSRQYLAMKRVLADLDKSSVLDFISHSALPVSQQWRVQLLFLSNTNNWKELEKRALIIPGPADIEQRWLSNFMHAVARAMLGDIKTALEFNSRALALAEKPESLNNQGVLLEKGGGDGARFFERALTAFPGYLDAKHNQQRAASQLTLVPLR